MLNKLLFPWKHNKTKTMAERTTSEEEEVAVDSVLLDLHPCSICGRTFLPEPLLKHSRVCERNATRKRKIFDSLKQRVEGTDLAPFHQKSFLKKPESTPSITITAPSRQSKWKEKHWELVNAIRAAKGVPDRMPSPNKRSATQLGTPTHERCPSCDRQFGPKAYDRHVEWCKERKKGIHKSPANVLLAKERLEARTKYKVPPLGKSKLAITREKYSPQTTRSESIVSLKSVSACTLDRSPSTRRSKTVVDHKKSEGKIDHRKDQVSEKAIKEKVEQYIGEVGLKNVASEKSVPKEIKKHEPLKSSHPKRQTLTTKINTVAVNDEVGGLTVTSLVRSSTGGELEPKKLVTWKDTVRKSNSVLLVTAEKEAKANRSDALRKFDLACARNKDERGKSKKVPKESTPRFINSCREACGDSQMDLRKPQTISKIQKELTPRPSNSCREACGDSHMDLRKPQTNKVHKELTPRPINSCREACGDSQMDLRKPQTSSKVQKELTPRPINSCREACGDSQMDLRKPQTGSKVQKELTLRPINTCRDARVNSQMDLRKTTRKDGLPQHGGKNEEVSKESDAEKNKQLQDVGDDVDTLQDLVLSAYCQTTGTGEVFVEDESEKSCMGGDDLELKEDGGIKETVGGAIGVDAPLLYVNEDDLKKQDAGGDFRSEYEMKIASFESVYGTCDVVEMNPSVYDVDYYSKQMLRLQEQLGLGKLERSDRSLGKLGKSERIKLVADFTYNTCAYSGFFRKPLEFKEMNLRASVNSYDLDVSTQTPPSILSEPVVCFGDELFETNPNVFHGRRDVGVQISEGKPKGGFCFNSPCGVDSHQIVIGDCESQFLNDLGLSESPNDEIMEFLNESPNDVPNKEITEIFFNSRHKGVNSGIREKELNANEAGCRLDRKLTCVEAPRGDEIGLSSPSGLLKNTESDNSIFLHETNLLNRDEYFSDYDSVVDGRENVHSQALSFARLEREARKCCSDICLLRKFSDSNFESDTQIDLRKFVSCEGACVPSSRGALLTSDEILEIAGEQFLTLVKAKGGSRGEQSKSASPASSCSYEVPVKRRKLDFEDSPPIQEAPSKRSVVSTAKEEFGEAPEGDAGGLSIICSTSESTTSTTTVSEASPRFLQLVKQVAHFEANADGGVLEISRKNCRKLLSLNKRKVRRILDSGESLKLPRIVVPPGNDDGQRKSRGEKVVLPKIAVGKKTSKLPVINSVWNEAWERRATVDNPKSKSGNSKKQTECSKEEYNPFVSAERQLRELLECDDFKTCSSSSTSTIKQITRPQTTPNKKTFAPVSSTSKKPSVKSADKAKRNPRTKSKSPKRASVIDPPPSFQDRLSLLSDDFELIENLINDNCKYGADDNDKTCIYSKQDNQSFNLNVILNKRKYSDDLSSIDPRLINEYDNLSIPENLSIEEVGSPVSISTFPDALDFFSEVDHYSERYENKIEGEAKPKKSIPLINNVERLEDLQIDEFMITLNEFEHFAPKSSSAKKAKPGQSPSKTIETQKSTVSVSSSVGLGGDKKKNLSSLKRTISLLDPVQKPKPLKSKQDVQKYFHEKELKSPVKNEKKEEVAHSNTKRKPKYTGVLQVKAEVKAPQTPKPEELFSVDDEMYEEYKKYEEMYLKEKEEKRLKEERRVSDGHSGLLTASEDDDSQNLGVKLSADSAYGSLNRKTPKVRARSTKLTPLESQRNLVGDSASSSGSESSPPLMTTTPSPSQKLSKFCHECGSKYPVATAKFCVECGVRRLVL